MAGGRRIGHRAETVGQVIGAGQNRQHSWHRDRFRRLDCAEPGMRVRRPDHEGICLARQIEIVAVAALAGQEPPVFEAPYRLTYNLLPEGGGTGDGSKPMTPRVSYYLAPPKPVIVRPLQRRSRAAKSTKGSYEKNAHLYCSIGVSAVNFGCGELRAKPNLASISSTFSIAAKASPATFLAGRRASMSASQWILSIIVI